MQPLMVTTETENHHSASH